MAKRHTRDSFIEKANIKHQHKYDYSKVDYVNNSTKVCIICPIHGEFWQTPGNHMSGQSCPKCCGRGYTKEEMVQRFKNVHGDKYDYSKVEFVRTDRKVCIICPIHGEFWQTPYKHMTMGQGCPKCGSSHLENDIRNLLLNNNINFEEQKTFAWLKYYKNLRLDFYLPDYNVAIECQGIQHFQPVDFYNNGKKSTTTDYTLTVKRDKIKKRLCEEHNIKIFYYSNVDIVYPYNVYNNKKLLLNEIKLN